MSIKRNVFAVAATLAVAAGVVTLSASAATSACGTGCISIFSLEQGTYGQPNVVEAVLNGAARVGQPVILSPASSSDPSQDFFLRPGKVSTFYAAGMVSDEVNSRYGDLDAAQIEYAPFADDSNDLCVGVASTAFQGQGLTLQPCTVPARTVWIADAGISRTPPPSGFFPIVNASTTDFARPFAMSYPRDQQATGQRLQQIEIRRLQFLSEERSLPDRQLWGAHFGVLP
jgi:hypothetical protein